MTPGQLAKRQHTDPLISLMLDLIDRYSLAEAPQRPLELAAWALACIFAVELIAPPSRLSSSARGTIVCTSSLVQSMACCSAASFRWPAALMSLQHSAVAG